MSNDKVQLIIPDILAPIFSHLDVRSKGWVAQVCCAWRDACYILSIWRDVEVTRLYRQCHSSMSTYSVAFAEYDGLIADKPNGCKSCIYNFIPHVTLESLDLTELLSDKLTDLVRLTSKSLTTLKLGNCECSFNLLADECPNLVQHSIYSPMSVPTSSN